LLVFHSRFVDHILPSFLVQAMESTYAQTPDLTGGKGVKAVAIPVGEQLYLLQSVRCRPY
jgi:hypothetical protein